MPLSLQTFQRPYEYRVIESLWEKVKDVYNGLHLRETRQKYLIQRASEPEDAYQVRLKQSYLENRFRSSIDSYAGLLSDFKLKDVPDDFMEQETDIDLKGNNFILWSMRADIKMLRDGQCLVGAEIPEALTEEEQRRERKPYLLTIDIDDVFNPVTRIVDGKTIIEEISIRRNYSFSDTGENIAEYWRYVANEQGHETPTRVEVWVEELSNQTTVNDTKRGLYLDREYPLLNARGEPLGKVPYIWYSSSPDSEPMHPDYPPFLSLCDLNLAHMNKESELDDVETTANRPTPYRIWPGDIPDRPGPLILGQNGCLEGSNGTEYGFLEPKGDAIAITQERQASRETRMDREDQKFLGGGQTPKTLGQAMLETAQSRMSFKTVARRKQSVMQEIFKLWQELSDPTYEEGSYAGEITIDESSLKAPPTAQDVQQVFQGFTMGVYPRQVAEYKLKEMGWWPERLMEESPSAPIDLDQSLEQPLNVRNGRQEANPGDLETPSATTGNQ